MSLGILEIADEYFALPRNTFILLFLNVFLRDFYFLYAVFKVLSRL